MALEYAGAPDDGLAGIMFKEMSGDFFPRNLLVREVFGFNAMKTSEDETKLLGVYQGLKMLGVRDCEVEQWHKQGTLQESIIKFYDDHYGCSEYFTWFKKTKYVLEKAKLAKKGTKAARPQSVLTDLGSRKQ